MIALRHALAVLLFFIVFTNVSFGEEPYGKLPKNVVPLHYDISIYPDIKNAVFDGKETVDIEVKEPVISIILNTLELNIITATLIGYAPVNVTIKQNANEETTTFNFNEKINPGRYKLEIVYTGKINTKSHGLFLAWQHTSTGKKKPLLATQMEAADARRVFPCWDEPAFKATFSFSARVPKQFMTVSNMPEISEENINSDFKLVKFSTTPKMSTYLLVFVAGELEYISGEIDGTKIRVITPPGKKEKGEYALWSAKKLLHYYNEYFGIKYPLAKLDLISAPFGVGAMENWGGIIFNEDLLLFDSRNSSINTKKGVFETIAHEIAHQWFGNLVTMAWWDDLWLNESFATWMAVKVTDHFNPKWNEWLNFRQAIDHAMETDSRKTTFPVRRPVENESQATQAFDEITYLKGASVIRMIENYAGESLFKNGIREYMKTFKYSNAVADDFWKAIEKTGGKPFNDIVANWLKEPGFPLVKIKSSCQDGEKKLLFSQSRFTYANFEHDSVTWKIPIYLSNTGFVLLDETNKYIVLKDCSSPVIIRNQGYFRIDNDANNAIKFLSGKEKVALLSDSWALVRKGDHSLLNYIELVKSFRNSRSLPEWNQILSAFYAIDRLAIGTAERKKFRQEACNLLRPLFYKLGWDKKRSEDENITELRGKVITALGDFEDQSVIKEAFRRFYGFISFSKEIPPYLRPAVFKISGKYGSPYVFNKLHELAKNAKSEEEKLLYYHSMLSTLNPHLANKGLMLSLTDELDLINAAFSIYTVAYEGEKPEITWEFAKKHLKALLAKLPSMEADQYVPKLFGSFQDEKWGVELEYFAKDNLPVSSLPQVAKAVEKVYFQADLKRRLLPQLEDWLK